ncbi:MAG TPA: histidine kinase [Anaerolineales bacterium]|jgi:signal transduction histidine kinase|nr:histidine kinase [Anaerolineales bacterium]
MDQTYAPRGYRGGYLISFLILFVVVVRAISLYWDRSNFIPSILLLGIFAFLHISETRFAPRLRGHQFLYFPVQAALVAVLSSLRPFLDVFNLLYIVLSMHAIHTFPRRVALGWIVIFTIMLAVTTILGSGWLDGIVLSLSYLAGLVFVVSYDVLYTQAQSAQAQSQILLAELQGAHQELREYAAQADELTAARERNRLARQLHDSVSQVIFSITLTAHSAHLLLERDPGRVPELLDRLQEMTAGALGQLRSLIAQLRPPQKS